MQRRRGRCLCESALRPEVRGRGETSSCARGVQRANPCSETVILASNSELEWQANSELKKQENCRGDAWKVQVHVGVLCVLKTAAGWCCRAHSRNFVPCRACSTGPNQNYRHLSKSPSLRSADRIEKPNSLEQRGFLALRYNFARFKADRSPNYILSDIIWKISKRMEVQIGCCQSTF